MRTFLAETFREMFASVPWKNVVKTFTIAILCCIALLCFCSGLYLAIEQSSLLPLLLWIVPLFVASVIFEQA